MHKWYRGAAIVGLILTLSAPNVFAVAEAGVPSLIIPPGARANGMGESYVALAQDATAAWWNPGGLAFVKGRNFAFMHSQLVPDLASDVYYEFLGYSSEIGGIGTMALSIVYLTYGESIATNPEGTPLRYLYQLGRVRRCVVCHAGDRQPRNGCLREVHSRGLRA